MTGLLEVLLVAWPLVAAGTWLAVVVAAPRDGVRGTVRKPSTVRLWLHAPFWVPVVVLAATFAPGLVGALLGQGDHCFAHGGHHHHLCLLHPPHAAGHAAAWVLPLALLLPVALLVLTWSLRVLRERRLARALVATSRPSNLGRDVRLLDRAEPLALTVGLRRPSILLSTGLVREASRETLRVVLEHERAHVARRDTLWSTLDDLVASLLPRRVRCALLDELSLAREQACDAVAAERCGDPMAVALALTEVARLGLLPAGVGVSVASSSLEARVTHLLAPEQETPGWLLLPFGAILASVVAGAGPAHTAIEHLVSLLLH